MEIDGMKVVAHTDGCEGKHCPTIYRKDDETVVVQGYDATNLFTEKLPSGELAVAIPVELFRKMKL